MPFLKIFEAWVWPKKHHQSAYITLKCPKVDKRHTMKSGLAPSTFLPLIHIGHTFLNIVNNACIAQLTTYS